MLLEASCSFEMFAAEPATSIFMLRAQTGAAQRILEDSFDTWPQVPVTEYIDAFGNLCQRLVVPAGEFRMETKIKAESTAEIDVHPWAPYTPVEQVPNHILQFLLPSRYCESDKLTDLALVITRDALPGYPQVEAIRQWVHSNFTYQYGITNSSTSALDVLNARIGVCRDFAHVCIALCRNLDIPARMVVGYLHNLKPMDLHAWFEAYVGGRWYTFDATQPEPKGKRITIAYGRDAADVAFATHFGFVELKKMTVTVNELQ